MNRKDRYKPMLEKRGIKQRWLKIPLFSRGGAELARRGVEIEKVRNSNK